MLKLPIRCHKEDNSVSNSIKKVCLVVSLFYKKVFIFKQASKWREILIRKKGFKKVRRKTNHSASSYGDKTKIAAFLIREGREKVEHDILRFFSTQDSPNAIRSRDIATLLGYGEEDLAGFWDVLHMMLDKHLLEKNSEKKYSLSEHGAGVFSSPTDLARINGHEKSIGRLVPVIGMSYSAVISLRREGMSQVSIPDFEDEVYVDQQDLNGAFDRDEVRVTILSGPSKKENFYRAYVDHIIKRTYESLSGRIAMRRNRLLFFPDSPNFPYVFYGRRSKKKNMVSGDKVVFSDFKQENEKEISGNITKVIGKAGDPSVEMEALLHTYDIDKTFPSDVIQESKKHKEKIYRKDISSRLDYTDANTFTIDPSDAKDFDDAISVKFLPDSTYEIGVHIADVSHFVEEGTLIDKEAFHRATSVYLVDRVIPMLPSSLCENICSLKPNVKRLAYSVVFIFNRQAKVLDYRIEKTVLISKRRFSYEEAQQVLDTKKGDFYKELSLLNRIAKKLFKTRVAKGTLEFVTEEWKFHLDEEGKPVDAYKKPLLDTNKLIEELMLLTNRTVAEHMATHYQQESINYPIVFRIHDRPVSDKVVALASLSKTLGYSLILDYQKRGVTVKAKAIQQLLDSVKDMKIKHLLSDMALRSMSKAAYSCENVGHFGLSFDYYVHFTSPIRRYPDLVTHRLLYAYEKNRKAKKAMSARKAKKVWQMAKEVCQQSSLKERTAIDAERKSIAIKQVEFIQKYIGGVFDGIITGISEYGMFIKLIDFGVEGLVSMRDISKDDYYVFDKKTLSISGKRKKKSYRFGDKLLAKIISVDPYRYKVNFLLHGKSK